jgi:indolepyruvate ferredoxin oxidoreductase beta subunit
MPHNLIITGVGGQGNVFASQIVGRAAVEREFRVTIGETFGLSQRGGPVMSHIRLLLEYGNKDTVFIVNSRPIYPLNVISGDVEYPDPEGIRSIIAETGGQLYWLDATEMAVGLGDPILLNMIMLGALCGLSLFPLETKDFKNVLEQVFERSKLEINYKALDMGEKLVTEYEN